MFTKKFKDLAYKNVDIAGGKGASLGEMMRNKFSIPPGFVVLAGAYERFLEETDLSVEIEAVLKKVKMKDIHSVEDASETIRDMIKDTKFPKDIGEIIKKEFKILGAKEVAVRSSATAEDSSVASWAGELESYLNVNEKGLLNAVKKCWSSLFTPRAIFYRYEKKLHDQYVSVAVVVQKMIQSDVSGICFTAHPVTNDRNKIVIEAGWGLGEAIVGGKITPDTYIIDKRKNKILDKNISEQKMMIVYGKNGTKEAIVPKVKREKQKITDSQIVKIAKICQNIENHYKKPQDIEWAIEKGKIYITQSRPITTLKV
jgi:pyruvate, water dikinase